VLRCVQCDNELVAPIRFGILEREARLSYLALREMLRLFFAAGFLFCRHRHGAVAGCFYALGKSSGLSAAIPRLELARMDSGSARPMLRN
jgi:hypothetical protein